MKGWICSTCDREIEKEGFCITCENIGNQDKNKL